MVEPAYVTIAADDPVAQLTPTTRLMCRAESGANARHVFGVHVAEPGVRIVVQLLLVYPKDVGERRVDV